jgi:O-methyltransferase
MVKFLKRRIREFARHLGYDIIPYTRKLVIPGGASSDIQTDRTQSDESPPDFDESTIRLCQYVQPFTMTSKERIFALRKSVEYIVKHEIPGAIVECGVWKGGSMMAIARTLLESGNHERVLYLFDTFEGMPEPSDIDRSFQGEGASYLLERSSKESSPVWAFSPLAEVKQNMQSTGYDEKKVIFVRGNIEETVPLHAPDQIALLRLDTDWYESTFHELTHLFPRLSIGGVLIIDDYGHWKGARAAVDRYLAEHNVKVLLARIDYTGRMCVKIAP